MTAVAGIQSGNYIHKQMHIAPLAVLRIAFGAIMFISTLRFLLKGWVQAFYIKPTFHFTFYGFDWVKPLGAAGMYVLFAAMLLATVMITIGLFYRFSVIAFFLSFTYVELIDKTTYLNHYYFISIMAFLMIWVPAQRYFSVDVLRKPSLSVDYIPAWCVNIFRFQLLLVYFFAGVSKLNYDWLIAAMPLRIWLPAQNNLPIIGGLLAQLWVAYAFSWFGAIFDLAIGFMLLAKPTRKLAYVLVIVFHLATGLLFKIGMFPYIMIFVTIIYFSADTHQKIIRCIKRLFGTKSTAINSSISYQLKPASRQLIYGVLMTHFAIQLLLPFRFLLYPGKLYWTEEGYRFSWRVMLMEKAGLAVFYVKDPATGHCAEISNPKYLTRLQEDMMATQPDMILQYAHYLAKVYQQQGIKNPIVTAESYVTLNGSGSMLYIDSTVNLAKEQESFGHKNWIKPFHPPLQ